MYFSRLLGLIGPLNLSLIFGVVSIVGGAAALLSPPGLVYILGGGLGIVGLVGAALSLLSVFAHRRRSSLRPAVAAAPLTAPLA